jgi:hypothetical protein
MPTAPDWEYGLWISSKWKEFANSKGVMKSFDSSYFNALMLTDQYWFNLDKLQNDFDDWLEQLPRTETPCECSSSTT